MDARNLGLGVLVVVFTLVLLAGLVVADPPAAPTDFYGDSVTANSITWHWTDNSSDEMGFEVQDESDSRIADAAANTTSVTETGIEENTV
jgi:hypothetical protein